MSVAPLPLRGVLPALSALLDGETVHFVSWGRHEEDGMVRVGRRRSDAPGLPRSAAVALQSIERSFAGLLRVLTPLRLLLWRPTDRVEPPPARPDAADLLERHLARALLSRAEDGEGTDAPVAELRMLDRAVEVETFRLADHADLASLVGAGRVAPSLPELPALVASVFGDVNVQLHVAAPGLSSAQGRVAMRRYLAEAA